MWGTLKRLLASLPHPPGPRPPEVAVDDTTAEVRFNNVPQWRIEWSAVREVAVEVTVVEDVGYSEAFWQLAGEGVDFGCPVELVTGADEFNARVFALPGFDHEAYHRSRDAEATGRPGRFVCWQAADAEPGAAHDPAGR
jgi:hypothetical protein